MTWTHNSLQIRKAKKVAVQLSVNEYEYLIEELEMKEDIELYKKVKAIRTKVICHLKYILKNE